MPLLQVNASRPRSRLAPWCVAVDRPGRAEGTSGLDQGKRRGAFRSSLEAEHIDLGNEPPLSVDGEASGLVDRHRVSVQWFSGTILTGLCGAALMSGAVFAALDGETNFATVPERVEAALRGAVTAIADRVANVTRKTDRLPPPGEANAARQVIRVSTTSPWKRQPRNRAGAPVHSRRGQSIALGVRAFRQHSRLQCAEDPRQVRGTSGECRRRRRRRAGCGGVVLHPRSQHGLAAGKDCGGGVPSTRCSLACAMLPTGTAIQVRKPRMITNAMPATLTAYAPERHGDPYAGFEPRIVPENVTLLAQNHRAGDRRQCLQRAHHRAQEGRFCSARSCARLGATADEVKAITAAFGGRGKDSSPRDGYKLRVLLAPASDVVRLRPVRVIIATEAAVEAMVAWSEMGKYVAVDVRSANSVASSRQRRRGRRQGRAALPEHLRNRVTQSRAPPGDRRSHPHLLL